MSQFSGIVARSLRPSRRYLTPYRCVFYKPNGSLTTVNIVGKLKQFSSSAPLLRPGATEPAKPQKTNPPTPTPAPKSSPSGQQDRDSVFDDHEDHSAAAEYAADTSKGFVSPPAPQRLPDGSRTLPPLTRPIGVMHPPHAEENSGVDERSLKQRKKDFMDYSKHIERREELKTEVKREMTRSYFQDFSDMRHHHGKIFVAPSRIFKGDKALYFPNLRGRTAASPDVIGTTQVFSGRVSVVGVFSSAWAENQVKTFTDALKTTNIKGYSSAPDDYGLDGTPWTLKSEDGLWQQVRINCEDNFLKAWMVIMSMGNIRSQIGEEMYSRYMLVRSGLTDELKQSIGMLNSKVGSVYLVDAKCRIRWAGSGDASEEERQAMVKGLERLVMEEGKRRESLRKQVVEKGDSSKTKKEEDEDEI